MGKEGRAPCIDVLCSFAIAGVRKDGRSVLTCFVASPLRGLAPCIDVLCSFAIAGVRVKDAT